MATSKPQDKTVPIAGVARVASGAPLEKINFETSLKTKSRLFMASNKELEMLLDNLAIQKLWV